MPVIRTQVEILTRCTQVSDIFGTQISDLVSYLTFENAKPFLKDEYIKEIESGEEEWEQLTMPEEEIRNYLPFAYDKARNERGLSAQRSILHFRSWIWLCDDAFYNKLRTSDNNNNNDYGVGLLDEISEWIEKGGNISRLEAF